MEDGPFWSACAACRVCCCGRPHCRRDDEVLAVSQIRHRATSLLKTALSLLDAARGSLCHCGGCAFLPLQNQRIQRSGNPDRHRAGPPACWRPAARARGAGRPPLPFDAFSFLPPEEYRSMQPEHTRAVMAISLMAAFADEHKDEREREHLRQLAESLSAGTGLDLMKLYQDVLLQRVRIKDAAQALDTPALRQLAYEMAVGVCDADGVCNAQEKAFLQRLGTALQMAPDEAAAVVREADALAAAPLRDAPVDSQGASQVWAEPAAIAVAGAGAAAAVAAGTAAVSAPGQALAPVPAPVPVGAPAPAVDPHAAEIDSMVLNASILNGALELLPQSLASMAIIPLQTRLVYRIGKLYGYELDKGHITDFLATVGVGLTSQYVEQFGRKLVGGLLGKVMGGMGRAVGSAATGSAFSFATTYALGKVAQRYYAGGRTLGKDALKTSFSRTVDEARNLQQRYAPQIQQRAQGLDVGKLLRELRA
ncbi:DUF533 domain-containing protein [Acidovorax sp. SUPP3434]|uniref:YcjF family protein n=1 Tax=Acidovorax sp. SUPP3434 TaxID=2920880 RepID=UPI0024E119CB|nr:DUF533 domain-containing protein [Acidovorax sp. SUPP3434]